MATDLAVGDLVVISCWSKLIDQAAANTFCYQVLSIGSPPATDFDVTDALSSIYATILSTMPNDAIYQGAQGVIVRSTLAPRNVQSTTGAGSGVAGATALPRQVAGITSWYTPFRGRSNRGRTYWPFPSVTQDSGDGVPNGGYTGTIGTIVTALMGLTSISASGRTATVQMRIRHRKTTGAVVIDSGVTRAVWATQRRRGAFGRQNRSPFG